MNTLRQDARANDLGLAGILKSLVVPTPFNAVLWLRMLHWLERHRLPTFVAFRYLYHVHRLYVGRAAEIGPGLRLPHPPGVLIASEMSIGPRACINGSVRFTRSWREVPRVGADAFIGDGAIFTGKARIGDRVVVGAGSVVTGHFGDDLVIAGNPARVLKRLPTTTARQAPPGASAAPGDEDDREDGSTRPKE